MVGTHHSTHGADAKHDGIAYFKRRMREAVTPLIPSIKDGVNLIFIARDTILEAPFLTIRDGMRTQLLRAGLIKSINEDE